MESLVYAVVLILAGMYGSTLLGLIFSFFGRHISARIITYTFSWIGIVLGGMLIVNSEAGGNSLAVGGIPIVVGAFNIYNAIRTKNKPNTTQK